MSRSPSGPTGLGTSAARLSPPHQTRPVGESIAVPPLHCPGALRDDPALGEALNEHLVDWASQMGLYPGKLDALRSDGFGRLVMLCHPETDDLDRLLVPARCTLAAWALDDHYCDEPELGARPELLGSRLAIAAAAVNRARLPPPYAAGLEDAVREDPVLRALRSAIEYLALAATPDQTVRACHAFALDMLALGQEGSWRTAGRTPAVWEYLTNRQYNSFLPCLAVIDVVGGYRLAPQVHADPRVRAAVTTAALASSLVNDIYSLARKNSSTTVDFNLPQAIAAEHACPLQEAVERSAALHDELMRRFEAEASALSLSGPPELRRYLAGISAWCGGNHAWHRTSARYAARTSL
ncbi:family 2 encapsulin nanocompartment cargo protein terpene cyclase [Streptomyces melanogenes]|uniref:family 2 encapsulin nanocompartment cargo protein terpene cyclase n=1 Tax=Streptomyces melanogenes TaxID=67326 RepID=UPI00167F07C5|nr:family 2 encapsulin nanocompartment cargo protein terpene cyclase [Streptomyces melanogenes]